MTALFPLLLINMTLTSDLLNNMIMPYSLLINIILGSYSSYELHIAPNVPNVVQHNNRNYKPALSVCFLGILNWPPTNQAWKISYTGNRKVSQAGRPSFNEGNSTRGLLMVYRGLSLYGWRVSVNSSKCNEEAHNKISWAILFYTQYRLCFKLGL